MRRSPEESARAEEEDDGQFAWADSADDPSEELGGSEAREMRNREAAERGAKEERERVAELLAQIAASKQREKEGASAQGESEGHKGVPVTAGAGAASYEVHQRLRLPFVLQPSP